MQSFDELVIPNVQMLTSDGRPTYTFQLYMAIAPIVEHTEYGQRLLKTLSEDPSVQAMAGKLLSLGTTHVAVQPLHLAAWFIWCARQVGEAMATAILNEWLDAEQHEVISTLWVLGLEVDASIPLHNGITISTIAELPDSDDKENYLTVSRDRLGPIPTRQPTCAITQRAQFRKFCGDGNEIQAATNRFTKNVGVLYDIAALLNALPGVVCVPYCQTCYIPELRPPGSFGGRGSSSPIHDVATGRWGKLPASAADKLNALTEAFFGMRDADKEWLRLILGRLSQAKRRLQAEDKILDLAIALEMLVLDSERGSKFELAVRGSWLLGKTVAERQEKFDLLSAIYNARNAVAHRGSLSSGRITRQSFSEVFPHCEALTEELVQRVILGGRPDWKALILGAS